jgi:hypothetical protein
MNPYSLYCVQLKRSTQQRVQHFVTLILNVFHLHILWHKENKEPMFEI